VHMATCLLHRYNVLILSVYHKSVRKERNITHYLSIDKYHDDRSRQIVVYDPTIDKVCTGNYHTNCVNAPEINCYQDWAYR